MLVFVPHMWYFFKYHEMYHICGIFLMPQEGKNPPLDVPFPENMVSQDGGERSAAVPCFSLYVNQSSCCMNTGFHWGGNIQSSEFTHIFFMGIFANEKGTGFDARSFFERLYQCQKLYNSLMDNKKYDSLLFKSKASPILQNLLIPFLGERLFRCVLQLHAGHDLRYGDFSGPPQRWPYLLFKGFIFTTA